MQVAARELARPGRARARFGAAETKQDLLRLFTQTLGSLFPGLVGSELYLVNDRDQLVLKSRFGDGPRMTGGDLSAPQRFTHVNADGRLAPAPDGVKRGSLMTAPLLAGRSPVGMVVVEAAPEAPFGSLELEILERAAHLFSLALQQLRDSDDDGVRAAIELDRRMARSVQRRFIGGTLPPDVGVKVDAQYLPALDVGGDFYELAHLGEGRVGGAIGDVSGKGISAALIMSRVSADLKRALLSGVGPSRVLEKVDATLAEVDSETFVTASCIHLDARGHTLTVANAGHLPLMVRRATGETFAFGSASGTPLGVVRCTYAEERMELRPLDIVLLMTDGLVEALDSPRDPLGTALLHRLVGGAPHDPRSINGRILEAANEMRGPRQLDDVTLVALQLEK